MAVAAFKTIQNDILKRAILDFRWFYALWGWALQGFSRQSAELGAPGILTAACRVGHSRDKREM